MRIRLIKPLKGRVISYEAELLHRDERSVVVRAAWPGPDIDFGIFSFLSGDTLIEHYYSDRWYNIFDLRAPDGGRKGWYCNATRPARIGEDALDSEDLELDLLVSADRGELRLDDEDEFAARQLDRDDPPAHQAALAAIAELRELVARAAPPFDDL